MSQIKDMGELRSSVNNNFMKISKQVSELCIEILEIVPGIFEKPPDPEKCDQTTIIKQQQTYYQSIVNLDKPCYIVGVLEYPNYISTKHIKVNMPRFDGTDVEHWLYAVRIKIFHLQ